MKPRDASARRAPSPRGPVRKPPLRLMTTTLWEYPSQDYDGFVRRVPPGGGEDGERALRGATPSWVVWQVLTRYTRENDLVVDPMAGSGTTLDVAAQLGRRPLGYDLTPRRSDVFRSDARKLPLEAGKADFVFLDPPYSTHLEYSSDARDIGRLDAGGPDGGAAYYEAMAGVLREAHRVLKDRRYIAVYASDSWRKRRGGDPGTGAGVFMPIGFELFSIMRKLFKPIDVVCVARGNAKLKRGNWHKAAEEGNFFLRGFNYLLIAKKEPAG